MTQLVFVFLLTLGCWADLPFVSWKQTESERALAINRAIERTQKDTPFFELLARGKNEHFAAKFEYYVDLLNLRGAHIIWAVAAAAQATGQKDYIAWGRHIFDSYWTDKNYIKRVFGYDWGDRKLNDTERRIQNLTDSLQDHIKPHTPVDEAKRLREAVMACEEVEPEIAADFLNFIGVDSVYQITSDYMRDFLAIKKPDLGNIQSDTIKGLLEYFDDCERLIVRDEVWLPSDSPLHVYKQLMQKSGKDSKEACSEAIQEASKKDSEMQGAFIKFIGESNGSLKKKSDEEILRSFLKVYWKRRLDDALSSPLSALTFNGVSAYVELDVPETKPVREYGLAFRMLVNPSWWVVDAIEQSPISLDNATTIMETFMKNLTISGLNDLLDAMGFTGVADIMLGQVLNNENLVERVLYLDTPLFYSESPKFVK